MARYANAACRRAGPGQNCCAISVRQKQYGDGDQGGSAEHDGADAQRAEQRTLPMKSQTLVAPAADLRLGGAARKKVRRSITAAVTDANPRCHLLETTAQDRA